MKIVPKEWMPNCSMKRVIIHWTASPSGYEASENDTSHYHILITGDGKPVRGTHSIKDNVSTGDNVYAAHTLHKNTGSIGVSVCCMGGAKENPFVAGEFPMTKHQWETMAQVVAELCDFYDIDVTEKTVLGHGEVEKNLGVKQHGKWDPMVLPWAPNLTKSEVGEQFRFLVKEKINGQSEMRESPAAITAIVRGKTFREAQIFNEKSIIKIRPLMDIFNGMILHASIEGIMELGLLKIIENSFYIPFLLIDHENEFIDLSEVANEAERGGNVEPMLVELISQFGFVQATDLSNALQMQVKWDGETRTVILG